MTGIHVLMSPASHLTLRCLSASRSGLARFRVHLEVLRLYRLRSHPRAGPRARQAPCRVGVQLTSVHILVRSGARAPLSLLGLLRDYIINVLGT